MKQIIAPVCFSNLRNRLMACFFYLYFSCFNLALSMIRERGVPVSASSLLSRVNLIGEEDALIKSYSGDNDEFELENLHPTNRQGR